MVRDVRAFLRSVEVSRSSKPPATSGNVKRILSQPTRKLTNSERKERTSFYEGSNVHAEAVEPDGNRYRRSARD